MKEMTDADMDEVTQLGDKIDKLLAGRRLQVQALVLSDVVAVWLARHPSELQETALKVHMETAAWLVETHEMRLAEGLTRAELRATAEE